MARPARGPSSADATLLSQVKKASTNVWGETGLVSMYLIIITGLHGCMWYEMESLGCIISDFKVFKCGRGSPGLDLQSVQPSDPEVQRLHFPPKGQYRSAREDHGSVHRPHDDGTRCLFRHVWQVIIYKWRGEGGCPYLTCSLIGVSPPKECRLSTFLPVIGVWSPMKEGWDLSWGEVMNERLIPVPLSIMLTHSSVICDRCAPFSSWLNCTLSFFPSPVF